MTKEDLRKLIAAQTDRYAMYHDIHTHAESVDQEKRLKSRIKASQGLVIPVNLKQAEWDEYLRKVQDGTYVPSDEPEEKYLNDWTGL